MGLGARMPRLPVLCRPKKKWRLAAQADPVDSVDEHQETGSAWRRSYVSIDELPDEALEVPCDQGQRGQVLQMSDQEARSGSSVAGSYLQG